MFSFMQSKKADARLKLDPDKPFFISKSYGRILLQFIYDNHDRYLFCASSDNAGGDYNYWLEKLELFKLNDDGSFYSYSPDNNLYYLRWGKVNATINPECLGDSIMSADRSLYADLDLEKDGEFSFVVRNPATGEKYYQKSLRVTREAMQELRDNGGRVTRKSLNYQEPAGSTSCFQLVLEFPNHHVYKYKLNRVRAVSVIYGNEWLTNDAEIEYQGNSYRLSKNLIDYSNLDCLVLITSNKLPFGMEKSGKFWELSLGLENPEQSWSSLQWRLYDGEEESRVRAFKKYNYKVGQNGGLVLGYSLIFSDDFLPNSDVYYGLIVYDQECPNCLGKKEGGCRLSVDFHKNLATCNECKRVYDLNTYGVIVEGDEGKRLICYRYADMAFDKEIREKAGIIEDGLLIYGNL